MSHACNTDFYLCFCFNAFCTYKHFIYCSCCFLFCALVLPNFTGNAVIRPYMKWREVVIYFPYCACAPFQKNIFDRIRGTYLFSKLTDRMCKQKTKTLCEKMFGEISTDFMFRLRFTEHIFPLMKLPVCYFLWENEQFKWLLDIQTMNSAWKFSRSCNNLCLPKVWKKRRLKKRDEFKLEAHSIHFFSFNKKKMKKNTTR